MKIVFRTPVERFKLASFGVSVTGGAREAIQPDGVALKLPRAEGRARRILPLGTTIQPPSPETSASRETPLQIRLIFLLPFQLLEVPPLTLNLLPISLDLTLLLLLFLLLALKLITDKSAGTKT